MSAATPRARRPVDPVARCYQRVARAGCEQLGAGLLGELQRVPQHGPRLGTLTGASQRVAVLQQDRQPVILRVFAGQQPGGRGEPAGTHRGIADDSLRRERTRDGGLRTGGARQAQVRLGERVRLVRAPQPGQGAGRDGAPARDAGMVGAAPLEQAATGEGVVGRGQRIAAGERELGRRLGERGSLERRGRSRAAAKSSSAAAASSSPRRSSARARVA